VQSAAIAGICPAVTVECGRTGGKAGVAHASEFLHAALSLSHFPHEPVPEHDLDLLQTRAIVKVPSESSFSFDGAPADFMFRPDIDRLNFSELEPGVSFGAARNGMRLEILPGDSDDHKPEDYFSYEGGEIRLTRSALPAMLTLDPRAVKEDCLCYLMHRIGMDGARL